MQSLFALHCVAFNACLSVRSIQCFGDYRITMSSARQRSLRVFRARIIAALVCAFAFRDAAAYRPPEPVEWWQTSHVYQIYPRSFMDSDGDGIGDLRGITSKLHYIADSGIQTIWLSPIFQSPMIDFGYDISDFRAIHYEYGTLADFDDMMAEAQALGIRVLLDLVPNHTSDQHEWFQRSVERDALYADYFIWNDGVLDANGVPQPPNNWVSVFQGSAWTWHEQRGQFYFHQFAKQQPDLNFRNPHVVQDIEDLMGFWLDRGVTGFRVDSANHLFEVEDLRDEPLSGQPVAPTTYEYLDHYYTRDLVRVSACRGLNVYSCELSFWYKCWA